MLQCFFGLRLIAASVETMRQPTQHVHDKLHTVQHRLQVNRLLQAVAMAGLCGLCFASIALVSSRFVPLPSSTSTVVIGVFLSAGLVAAAVNALRKPDALAVARLVDNVLGLKERMSTAIDLSRRGVTDDFATLQIHDAARIAQQVNPATVVPYRLPPTLKWLPIPILVASLALLIPRAYEIPPPPTPAERAAIDRAAATLENMRKAVNDEALAERLQEAAKRLKNKRIDANAAQNQLSQLRDEVQTRRKALPDDGIDKAIAETTGVSNAGALAAELEKLAQQMETLSPEQRAELDAWLRALAKRLTQALDEIGTEAVSAEQLRKIARALMAQEQRQQEMAQLEQMLDDIRESQKRIGLAGLNVERHAGGVADAGGAPGDESDTQEAQGTLASETSDFTPKPTTGEVERAIQEGAEAPLNPLTEPQETVRLPGDSESEISSRSTTQQGTAEAGVEPDYMPYQKIAISAQQASATATQRDDIPIRYRQLVKAYLDEISKLGRRDQANAE